jgi:hypothetical protein
MIESFAKLHFDLAALHDRNERASLIKKYFASEPKEQNRYWTRYLLSGGEQKRYVNYKELRRCTHEITGLPYWLIEECIRHTGNVTEAITLMVKSDSNHETVPLHSIMERIHTGLTESIDAKTEYIHSMWESLLPNSVYVFNKLITAGYRSSVSINEIERLVKPEETTSTTLRTIKAVLLYASQSEYIFAIWKEELLVPIVKTTSGIQPEEHLHIRKFVTTNTRERFGPVYSVNPELIFEIGFEYVERASRRKSGIKLTSPRIIRRCHDASLEDLDRVERLYAMVDE